MPKTPAPIAAASATRGKALSRQQALLKRGALQRAILHSAGFASIATDEAGLIRIFNVGAERMLGYTAAEVQDKQALVTLVDPPELAARALAMSQELGTDIPAHFAALICKAARGVEDNYELACIRNNGSRLPTVFAVTALRDPRAAIIGYLFTGTDNTARQQIEAERKQVEQALQLAKAAAEKANLTKSEFLSSMSHELRTPLNAMLGFAQLMEGSSPAPSTLQQRSIDQILKAGWYLLDLINEILDLALVESGTLSLSLEPIALAKVMRECQALVEAEARKHDITVSFPHVETLEHIHADHTRVKQILINLLTNAIKYNTTGGTVDVRCVRSATGRIRISIEDSGPGLSPAQLSQLFQPFNRLGREQTAVEGTGIGLVMTRRLVELMGGVMGVESVVGKGSTFWIELKLTDAQQLVTLTLQSPIPRDGNGYPELRTLLYVEDNPANLMLVEDLARQRPGIRLLSARDGVSGIAMARSHLPDMILLDINLPGINGLQVLALLAADPATAHIPVVALSANAMPRDIECGLQAGFSSYLTKPIRIDQFMTTLDLTIKAATARPKT